MQSLFTLRCACVAALLLGAQAAAAEPVPEGAFTPIHADLFNTPYQLSSAFADVDGDGDLDLAMSYQSGEIQLFRNDTRGFVSIGGALGLPQKGPEVRSLAWGDFDADGDPDLFASGRDKAYLFRNDGASGFKDVAADLGIVATVRLNVRQSTWVDFDLDGDLDLHIANRAGAVPDFLFRNDGGRFVEMAAEAGLADGRRAVGACWFDMDRDGDLDLFLGHQDGETDALYRNDRGKFTDIAPSLKMDRADRSGSKDQGSTGCAVGDYDNDGDFDLFVAAYGKSVLYRNEGGRFTDVSSSTGLIADGHAVGAAWGDYDNDGDLDLYVTSYHGTGETARPASYLFRNNAGHFENILRAESVLNAADHGAQWADFDRDGDLDMSLTRAWGSDRGAPLFRNELGKRGRSSSLQVAVVDTSGRQPGAGAEVRLFDRSGRLLGTRLVRAGDGYDAQSETPVHFGLASKGRVTVEVTYLTAAGRVTQRVEGVDPAKHVGRALVVRQQR